MKKLLILAVVSMCAFAGWRLLGGGGATSPAQGGDADVLDRVWVDHMPRHERDQFSIFVAITDEPVGVFQTRSVWKGHFEMFRHETYGDEIRILYPQDQHREHVKAKARKCSEDGFDYCLEIDGASRGVRRYYSRKGWEVDGAVRPEQLGARIEAALAGR
ncbi:MAG TPA: hypothetical protein VNO30_36940 [Kofleriaceae bacterium]|nr:hypothetical protein [Kofleriaceae bacterium]